MALRSKPQTPALLAVAAGLAVASARAAEPKTPESASNEALNAEFLEYLAQLEDEDDDWTLFEDDDAKPAAPAKPATSKPVVTQQPVAKAPVPAPAEVKR
jgi:hypothetical protein